MSDKTISDDHKDKYKKCYNETASQRIAPLCFHALKLHTNDVNGDHPFYKGRSPFCVLPWKWRYV